MIAYLKGKLLKNNIDNIIILVQGIGYKIYIPSNVQQTLPHLGEDIELHTHYYVREDNISLYGFLETEELELFEQLLDVSKIGPKVALSILSTMPARQFKKAIINNEVSILKEIKGIGNKTAKRLILELQEKIEIDNIVDNPCENIKDNKGEDAIQALVALGYKRNHIYQIVIDICNNQKEIEVEGIIKEALAQLS